MLIHKHIWWLLPIVAMAIATPFISAWDKSLEAYFYQNHFNSNAFYDFIYSYATIPALALAFLALPAFAGSYLVSSWKKWQRPSLVLILTMAVGAGFIVHTLLKDHWGRPRPKQIIEFGGRQNFRPYFSPNFSHQIEPSKSFPCGHCTMGFYFFSAAFVCTRLGYYRWSYFMYFFALLLGTVLGVTRMAQGGHFLSDVLMTALIMWLIAGAFDWLIYTDQEEEYR